MFSNKRFLRLTLSPVFPSLFLLTSSVVFAGTISTQPLFVIERSKNANKVHYEAILTAQGALDAHKPVHAFWINWEKDSTGKCREGLNLIEQRMAFGFSVDRSRSPQACIIKLVCCPKRPIKVYLSDGSARAETTINGQSAHLIKISVITREKKKFLPQVLSVIIYGTVVATGEAVEETITPR
jgi:hypothetical protein